MSEEYTLPPSLLVDVICHTETCEVSEVTRRVDTFVGATVMCGPCGQVLTDVTEVTP